jgi:hypothetical protein
MIYSGLSNNFGFESSSGSYSEIEPCKKYEFKESTVHVYAALWIRICIDFGRLDLDWIRIQSGQWIRIQKGNNDPKQKKKKVKKFQVLKVVGITCSLDVLHVSLEIKNCHKKIKAVKLTFRF